MLHLKSNIQNKVSASTKHELAENPRNIRVSDVGCMPAVLWAKRTPTCAVSKMGRHSKTDSYMHPAQNGTAFQNGLLYAPCKKMNGVPKLDSMTCTHACKRVGLERGWRRGMGKGGVVSNRWPIYFAKNVGPCSSNTYLICGVFWGLTEYVALEI